MKKKKLYKQALVKITNVSYSELRPIVEASYGCNGFARDWEIAKAAFHFAVEIAATALYGKRTEEGE